METTTIPAALDAEPIAATSLRRRGLFCYFDGIKNRHGDILAIQFRLQNACPSGNVDRLSELLEAITLLVPATGPSTPDAVPHDDAEHTESPPPPVSTAEPATLPIGQLAAMIELAPLIGAGFDLPPYSEEDGSGLNTAERILLVTDYFAEIAIQEAGLDPEPSDELAADAEGTAADKQSE